jgi:small conductance mechanosensitive channel
MHRNLSLRCRACSIALVAASLLTSAPALAAPPESADSPTKPIDLHAGAETDRAIEARLEAIYAELDELGGIEVEVEAGVVHLHGQARSLEAEQEAEHIAERVEGVAAITTDIQLEAKISRRLEPALERMGERVGGWLSYLPLIVVAVTAVALAWFLARVFARRSRRNGEPDTFGRQIAGQLVQAGIVAIGIVIALEVLGARGLLGAMIGTAGVIGIVLGIAFKNIGEAYIASVLLSIRRPFDPHDLVRIDDDEGSVVRLTSRATMLMTFDGNLVSIPNSKVFGATVVNFSRNPQRRFTFKLGVGFDADLRHVQEVAVSTIAAVPGVLSEPGPACLIEEFGESEIVISVAGWIDQRESDWYKVSSEAKRQIKVAFDQAGIDMPEPILRVRTTTFEPRIKAPEPRTEPSLDVSPDGDLNRQVAQERKARARDDLLHGGGGRLE